MRGLGDGFINPAVRLGLDAVKPAGGSIRFAGDDLTGQSPAAESYATEAGLFAAAGIPTIVCGPGDIAQAHRPDEWIAQSQLDECDAFIRRLAARYLVARSQT